MIIYVCAQACDLQGPDGKPRTSEGDKLPAKR